MKQVKTLKQLCKLADDKKCVITPSLFCFSKRIPAAFIQNMQGRMIQKQFDAGMYIYQKQKGR